MNRALVFSLFALLTSCGNSRDGTGPTADRDTPSSHTPAKTRVISSGEEFQSGDYLVPGYVVILDFYADW